MEEVTLLVGAIQIWWEDFSGGGTQQIFGYHEENSLRISPIRKTLRSVLVLLTVVTRKIVSESIYFQSNIFRGCKVKNGKEVAQSLMVLNLLKIIHPFQGIYRAQKEKKDINEDNKRLRT